MYLIVQSFTALSRVFHFFIFFFRFSSPGVFQSDNMDEELTRAVEEKSNSPVIPSKRKRPMPRVGSGKGSPLKPRKVHVSKRQRRVREKRGFDLSEFGRERRVASEGKEPSTSTAGDKTSNESTSPPPETLPPAKPPPPTAQETPASPPVQQKSSPTPLSPAEAPVAAETPVSFEDDGPLSLQVRHDSQGRGGVQRIQLLAAMSQDGETSSLGSDVSDQASDDELGLFKREIEHWNRADARMTEPG
jgi:hypothetical protein